MRQSNNRKSRDVTAFLYERLSRDDNLEGESYSIGNQKKLLTKVAKEKGYTNLVHFLDDGISGVTMDRPGFNDMMEQLAAGKAAAVFVKDLSRLGRNYIEVGRLTEEFFPEHDIRLVAVSDNIDTAEGENELAPIRNLFNEWYARDISKKRRISNKIKGNAGEPMGPPPYGYKKDPDDPKRWIVDEEAAQVVRRVFRMTLDGYGTEQIATIFSEEKILTPLPIGVKRASIVLGKANSADRICGTAPPSLTFSLYRSIAVIFLTSRPTPSRTRTKSGLPTTGKTGSSSRMSTNPSLSGRSLNRSGRSGARSASAAPTKGSAICSPAFWSALIADTTCTSISIRATPTSSILTAPTTRATVGPVLPPIMSVWTSWSRWC